MKKGQDITITFPNIVIIHQKVPGRELGRHCHKEHELFIPLQGELTVSYDDKSLTCGSGKMLYVPPNLEHSFSSTSSGQGERIICLFSDKLWKKITNKLAAPAVLPLNSLLRELLFYLLLNPKTPYSKTFVQALTECLVDILLTHKDFIQDDLKILESKIKDSRVKKAFLKIISSTEEISVSDLAKQSGLSLRNLNKLFLSEIGISPKKLMILKKINLAKELLLTSQMTITDISFEVGYNSLSKFISMFQKYTGKLPSEFRSE